jgi:putative membrane protein
MQGDIFEIQGGTLAEQKGSAAQVKAIGARYLKDHTASLKVARKLAKSLGIKRETDPTPSEQWELQEIGGFSGADFDKRYASLEVFDHRQDIMEAKDEIALGTNKRVVSEARKELTMLRTHLKLAKAAAAAVGA